MKKFVKIITIILVITLSFVLCSCKEEEKDYKLRTYKVSTTYDYYEFSGRGYYELKDEMNYKVQETYANVNNLEGFGIIQSYADYNTFLAKFEKHNFKYNEDFFKENSLIYISNQANDIKTVEGVRFTPFNIVNCVYDKYGCHIELDYLSVFYTYYQSAAAMGGTETEKSVHTFAFNDTEKKTFNVDISNKFNAYSFDSICYFVTSLKLEGETNMYIESINANTYIQFDYSYRQLGLNENETVQAAIFPILSFEHELTKSTFLAMSGTVFTRYKEYHDFAKMFDEEYYPFTVNRKDFDDYAYLLLIFEDQNHLFIDRNKICTSISVTNTKDKNVINTKVTLGDNNNYAKGFEIYLIKISKDIKSEIKVTIEK